MPHAGGGGGGGGGGFHSSSSGGGSSPKPRYDSYGRLHSTYYVRPGFYYNGTYVPYSAKRRKFNAILGPIFVIIFALIICAIMCLCVLTDNGYDESKLEEYAIDKYYDAYNEKSNSFESNILVTIVTYEEGNEFDYISIVGDDIDKSIDFMFGNQRTTFGGSIYQNINSTYTDLYETIAYGLDNVSNLIDRKYCSNNYDESKIINESEYTNFGDKTIFEEAEENFYNKTGYHVSILITSFSKVYSPEYAVIIVIAILFVVVCGVCVFNIVKISKAVNEVNKAIDNGEAKKYYEGEVDLEEYMKTNSYMKNNRNLN